MNVLPTEQLARVLTLAARARASPPSSCRRRRGWRVRAGRGRAAWGSRAPSPRAACWP